MPEIRHMSCLQSIAILIHITIFQICCVIATGQVWADGDEFIHSIFRGKTPQTAKDFHHLADSLCSLTNEPECLAEVASRVFRMNAWAFLDEALPSDWEDQIQIPQACHMTSARYHVLVGVMHYRSKNWVQASASFEQAIQLSRDSLFLTEAFNNLSATYEKIPNRVNDVIPTIEKALRFASHSQSPFLLNNIVALNIQMGHWSRAQEFSQRLPSDLAQLPNNLRFNILLNQMILGLRLEPAKGSPDLIEEFSKLDVTPGNECTFGRIASKYLLVSDEYEEYVNRYPLLLEMIEQCPDAQENVQTEGLLYQPWRQHFNGKDTATSPISREEWQRLRRTQFHFLVEELDHPEAFGLPAIKPVEESQSETDGWIWLSAIAALLLVAVAGWLSGRQRRRSERLTRKHLRTSLNRLRDLVNQTQSVPILLEEIQRLEDDWLSETATPLIEQFRHLEFTTLEEEILRLLANGRSSKEIASLLDVSLSHVYNIRTGLRKKFQLPESEDLDTWIADQVRILGRKRTG